MHLYSCPYCPPSVEAHLIGATMEEIKCKYKKENICEEKHKCKDVMRCKKCGEIFSTSKKFLKDQKRKIKDG